MEMWDDWNEAIGNAVPNQSKLKFLSTMDTITAKELYREHYVSKRHFGRVLYGQFRREIMLTSGDVITLLEDKAGDGIPVHTSIHLWRNSSLGLCIGRRVAVAEPLIEISGDGMYVLRLSNPAEVICLDRDNTDSHTLTVPDDPTPLEDLHRIRLEGNHFFSRENWAAAVNRYSQCIDDADNYDTISQENLNSVLLLSYTNRSEARLRLQHYQHALTDADEALKIEPNHVKSLVRKGKAAHALGLFQESCDAFESALEHTPGERSVLNCLMASNTSLEQSRYGKFDLYDYFLGGCKGEGPHCADFIGPVKIGPVSYHNGGRGLFATRNVKNGELLLVSNALACVPTDRNGPETLIAELAKRVKTSKRQTAQLFSLARPGKHDMEVPSMELFLPGSKWYPPGAETLKFDIGVIYEILNLNAFGMVTTKPTCKQPPISSSGLWVLPSFLNHSCIPNMFSILIGDALLFRATMDIMEGEELTTTYLSELALLDDVEGRQSLTTEGWFFKCKCVRCLFEGNLRLKLSKVSRPDTARVLDFSRLVLTARTRYFQKLQVRSAQEDLIEARRKLALRRSWKDVAKAASLVDDFIESHYQKLGPREKSWIRAAFLPAYQAKVYLAMEHNNTRSTISALKVVLESTASVWVSFLAVEEAAVLLEEVERCYSKDSESYQFTLDQVLGICRGVYGDLPVCNLLQLINMYIRSRKGSVL